MQTKQVPFDPWGVEAVGHAEMWLFENAVARIVWAAQCRVWAEQARAAAARRPAPHTWEAALWNT